MSEQPDRDLSALYRAGARETPPPALDRRILQAARAGASSSQPSLLGRVVEALPRWRIGLSLAAIATLTVSLVTVMEREQASLPTASLPRDADRPVERADAGAVVTDPPQALRLDSQRRVEESVERKTAVREAPESMTATTPAVPPRSSRSVERTESAQSADATPPATPESAAPAAPAPMPAAPPPRPESPTVASAAPAPLRKEAAPQALQGAPAARARSDSGATENHRARSEEAVDDPAVAVRRLLDLLRQGRQDDVRAGLAVFRRRHPDYPLPEPLQRLTAGAEEPQSAGSVPLRERPAEPARGRPDPP